MKPRDFSVRQLLAGPASLLLIAAIAGCQAPKTPETPNGPTSVAQGAIATFTTRSTDANPVRIQFDWGDLTESDWSELVGADSEVADTHAFVKSGLLKVRARAQSEKKIVSKWSNAFEVNVVAGESTLKWLFGFSDPDDPEDSLGIFGSVAATPDGGTIFVLSDLGFMHFVSSGGVRKTRSFQAFDEEFTNSPSVDADGRGMVVSDVGRLYSARPDGSGSPAWSALLGDDVEGLVAIDASGNCYVNCNDRFLYSYSPTGALRWKTTLPELGGSSSPVITRDGSTVVVGGLDSMIHAYAATDGTPVWSVPIRTGGQVFGSGAIAADNSIYIGSSDGSLYKLKPEGGDPVWQYAANSAINASPVIGTDGTIYFVSENGVLHAVNAGGTADWTLPLECIDGSTAAISSSGILYLTGSFGASDSLVAINLSTRARRWARAIPDRNDVEVAPLIDATGAVIITTAEYAMAFWGLGGPAESAWPMFQHDARRTGCAQ